MGNEFEEISLQVSTFANEPWKEKFLGIDICQIDQNLQNSGKLVPRRFVFNKIDIFKKYFKIKKNSPKTVSAPETSGVTKHRSHHAVSLL